MEENFKNIIIPTATGMKIYSPTEIYYCKATHKVTEIFFKNGKSKIINCSLDKIEKKLPAEIIFRCHRSYLVNLSYIKEYNQFGGNILHLNNGLKVCLSRRKRKDFYVLLNKLQNFISISH
jgi:two-component system, LytTR family, response regulator